MFKLCKAQGETQRRCPGEDSRRRQKHKDSVVKSENEKTGAPVPSDVTSGTLESWSHQLRILNNTIINIILIYDALSSGTVTALVFFPDLNEPARPTAARPVSPRPTGIRGRRRGESSDFSANRRRRTCRGQHNGGIESRRWRGGCSCSTSEKSG